MNNADYIRSLSNEELAKYLANPNCGCNICEKYMIESCGEMKQCKEFILVGLERDKE